MSCSIAALLLVSLFLSLHQSTPCCAAGADDDDGAAHSLSSCLISHGVTNFTLRTSPRYGAVLNSSISNLRFALPGVGKPAAVVLPSSKQDLQRAVLCARSSSLAIRVRSGGHSYEGLSYTTENHVPFVVIDLASLNRVRVDRGSATAWAESGATLGELYYAVGRSSRGSLAFSAGSCSTIGLGGIVSGGGFGLLSRKFGLAADNVLDSVLIDADGRALDGATMGRDVFWAIRGGGGGSWGVVYAWKLRLVPVPRNVTVFSVGRTGPVELVAGLIHRWQFVAPSLPDDFYLSVYLPTGGGVESSSSDGNVSVSFSGQVLGPKHRALSALRQSFPELGLTESELAEASWLDATAQFAGLDTAADLPNRQLGSPKQYSKGKSDYVQSPISRRAMAGILWYLSTGPPRGGRVCDPGPLRRGHGPDRERRHAVPAPRRDPVRRAVPGVLGRRGRRRVLYAVAAFVLRVHGPARVQGPPRRVRQLPGPRPRRRQLDRLGGRVVGGGRGARALVLGRRLLRGQLRPAGQGQDGGGPRQCVQQCTKHSSFVDMMMNL